ncbi:MAG: VanW family protein [Bifidobacteriaceae bacterium]|nr:VanW family protein [Bifidobacteriaceae bacterium]
MLSLGIVLVILTLGYLGACYALADRIPKGATVAGVSIGGLEREAAIELLGKELNGPAREPVTVAVGEQKATLDPVVAGLGFSAEHTVDGLTGLNFAPGRLWRHVMGIGAVPPALVVDSKALEGALGQIASQTRVEPQDGALSVAKGTIETTPPQYGLALELEGAVRLARQEFLVGRQPWKLPVKEQVPHIGQGQLDQAVSRIAKPLLSGPVSIEVAQNTVELPAKDLAAAAQIKPAADGKSLILGWDQPLLVAQVDKRLPEGVVTHPVDARFGFENGQPVILDGTAGTALDQDALVEAMTKAATAEGSARVASVPLVTKDPAAGKAELEQMGIKEVVGRFETQATSNVDRTKNLRKAAEMVTGTLVPPGETFSLNQALGHRSAETGWFDAGVVIDGVAQDGIGGGLSQFSTTLYNAAHLAGMVDVEHTPHSNYFSRYPMGREATIWEGQIDNVFKNDTPYGVVLRAGVTDDLKVWVELWSTTHWKVEAEIGKAYAHTQPQTIESTAADCKPQTAGGAGFQVDYWRIKTGPDGKAQNKETWHWRYDPMNAIVCNKPRTD